MTTKTKTPVETKGRSTQLSLVVDHTKPWRIDNDTKEIGRKGLAQARAVLAASRPVAEAAA
ncbi:MAG: hypothetical protein HKN94_00860 [Acidimicrobiales bacterium]|nr:hypothetical protein [Acidimicrobiales bacterium]RZV47787.1 MAG: hypothetical protein EX269_04045 [Acidimicrobiales bacterium]